MSYFTKIVVLFVLLISSYSANAANSAVGKITEHIASGEDSLVSIARKYGVGYVEIRAANPKIDPWIIKKGTKIIVPTMHIVPNVEKEGIVVNLPEMRLYAYVYGEDNPITFPIGIGRLGLSTPIGTTEIVRKMENPTWRPTQRMRDEDPSLPVSVPPGPDNPLGTHFLYFGWPTYGIHGTNKPYGIGRRVSSGCIRLYPEDIEQFYHMIPVGTKVRVIDRAVKVGWVDNKLYMEAHTEMSQVYQMEEYGKVDNYSLTDEQMLLILEEAGKYAKNLNWEIIRKAIKERSGLPVVIAEISVKK